MMVALMDGRQVDSYSEDWRHECEARTVLAMPTLRQRRQFLYGTFDAWGNQRGGVLQIRGEAEVKRLERTMMAMWRAREVAQ